MLGYWATGRVASATAPRITITIARTLASTGRLMKNAEIIAADRRLLGRRDVGSGRRRRDGLLLGHHLAAGHRLAVGRQHDAVLGGETLRHHPQPADQELPDLDVLLLDDVVLVDDQYVLAGLVLRGHAIGNQEHRLRAEAHRQPDA